MVFNSLKKRYDCKGFGHLLISFSVPSPSPPNPGAACKPPARGTGAGRGTQETFLQWHSALSMH